MCVGTSVCPSQSWVHAFLGVNGPGLDFPSKKLDVSENASQVFEITKLGAKVSKCRHRASFG